MAFTKTWNEGDLGSQYQDDIDDLIEDTRYGVRERAGVEHTTYADEASYTDVWLHKKAAARINYGLNANKPTAPAAAGTAGRADGSSFYATDTGLLAYWDDANDEWVTVASPNHAGITTTYTTGTADFANGSTALTGHSTEWNDNVSAGDVILGADGEYYNIASVSSNTVATLARAYAGSDASGQSYTIYLNGHPSYLPKGGGTVNGDLTVGGDLAVTGASAHTGAVTMADTLAVTGATTLTGGGTLGADLAAGSNKVTGLAAGDSNGDAVRYEQIFGIFARLKILNYTGSGVQQSVTGAGFQPLVAVVYAQVNSGSYRPVIKALDGSTGDDGAYSKGMGSGAWNTTGILSLDEDGFTVGTNAETNASGLVYTAILLG